MKVSESSIDVVFDHPKFPQLSKDYYEECKVSGLPLPNPNRQLYKQMEALGMLHVFVAHEGDELLGFCTALISPNPHYGSLICTIESLFVDKDMRTSGAGLRLLSRIKSLAKSNNVMGLFACAPVNSILSEVYRKMDCIHKDEIYFWRMDNE